MSTDTSTNDPAGTDDNAGDDDDNLAQLREAAKQGKTALSENAQLKRQIALYEAGVDTKSPVGKMFAKSYDGELTVEAITEAAKELGLIGEGSSDDDDPDLEQHRQGQETRDRLQGGSSGAPAIDLESDRGRHPVHGALEDFHKEKGERGEELAMLAAIDKVIVAGVNGDPRAIFDADAHYAEARNFGSGSGVTV